MLNWENNFKPRPDGRHTCSLAAWMHALRDIKPNHAFTEDCCQSPEKFAEWQKGLKDKLVKLLKMPTFTPQPDPVLLTSEQRDGYTLERWEFYPDDYTAIPVLILRPDNITEPVPGVLCCPGSAHPKELLAGESTGTNPNMQSYGFPERNCQALHCLRAGYIAAAFDNPGTGELAELSASGKETQWETREKLVQGYIEGGTTYLGMSVFQKLCFLKYFKNMPGVDSSRLGIMGHSLGTEAALCTALLSDDITVYIHNDFLCEQRNRYVAITELEKIDDGGNWHQVPGQWAEMGLPDMLAAVAPKYLTINEGGGEEFLNKVRRSYEFNHASDRLKISYYPRYQDKEKLQIPMPDHGLSLETYYIDYCSVDVPDHSFRPEVSLAMLKKAFGK